MTEEKDMDLVKRIQKRDQEAENDLFSRFRERIVKKVRFSLAAESEDCKDVISEIQIAVLVSLREGNFDPNRGISLGSYIYGITKNKIKDYFKLQKKRENINSVPLSEADIKVVTESELEKSEVRNLLRANLSKLKLKYKEVLYLKYYEGLSISQISQKINLPPRRVSERINYAIKLLRKECEKENILSILRCVWLIHI